MTGAPRTRWQRLWAYEPVDGPEMSFRARGYLVVAAYRHLFVGLTMVIVPGTYDGPGFQALFDIGSEHFWSLTMLAGGSHLLYAAYRGSIGHARVSLGIAVIVGAVWAAAFALVALDGIVSVFAFAYLSAFTLKDLLQLGQPMRSPFEDLAAIYGADVPKIADG